MKNWAKSYWSNCLSIAAIICSVVAICVSLPSAPELGFDYNGAIVGILSFLVTMLIGWQLYNAITIEKKIRYEVKKGKDSLTDEIENMRDIHYSALQKVLYRATATEIELRISNGDYNKAIESLQLFLSYTISINEDEVFKHTATVIANSKYKIDKIILLDPNDHDRINKAFTEFIQEILAHIAASEKIVNTLFSILEDIREDNEKRKEYKEYQEERRQKEKDNSSIDN